MSDKTIAKDIILDALHFALKDAERQQKPTEYDMGKIAGLKHALRLIHMLTHPAVENTTPIDFIINDFPPYTKTLNEFRNTLLSRPRAITTTRQY
ncbi:hypothetical protein [Paenibacillus sp. YYML68]|uniref:hypothetical protein n=1 Tax=Paenibacillus sp. YYML68 TaxID=2909250 RepID=UPI0024904E53|nr:hypothetical protein [Paenibacillus sp. YYML68]